MTTSAPIRNAILPDDVTVRVGVPHFNGSLPAHCSEENVPVMVSAGAFWRPRAGKFVDAGQWGWSLDACDVALDSAGFVAMKHWATQGPQPGMESIYPWSMDDYLDLVCDVWPTWWSQPDACCEPQIAGDDAAVRARIDMTARLLGEALEGAWTRSAQMRGAFLPPVPVAQGWKPAHYRESIQRMLEVWDNATLGTYFERTPSLIGIGSVCRRSLHDPEHGLFRILDAIADLIPKGSRLHLYGAKNGASAALRDYPIASLDSMAWDFTSRVEARKARRSNTMAHRIGHLDHWRARQAHYVAEATKQPGLFATG